MWGNEGKKKALKALERWPPDPGSGSKSPMRGKPMKRLKALERWPPDPGSGSKSPMRGKPMKRLKTQAAGKDKKERKAGEDIGVLQRWLQREKKSLEAPKTGLGSGKAKE